MAVQSKKRKIHLKDIQVDFYNELNNSIDDPVNPQ